MLFLLLAFVLTKLARAALVGWLLLASFILLGSSFLGPAAGLASLWGAPLHTGAALFSFMYGGTLGLQSLLFLASAGPKRQHAALLLLFYGLF